jgi:hypothetical protein
VGGKERKKKIHKEQVMCSPFLDQFSSFLQERKKKSYHYRVMLWTDTDATMANINTIFEGKR